MTKVIKAPNFPYRVMSPPERARRHTGHKDHPKFYTTGGWLTVYALSCGYVERAELHDGKVWVTLWREHDCFFHVKAHDFEAHRRICWAVFDNQLNPARRLFTRLAHTLSDPRPHWPQIDVNTGEIIGDPVKAA